MTSKPFARLLYDRLVSQAELFATFTAHTTLTGGGRERALRGLIAELLPRRYEVLTGTVATLDDARATRRLNRQLDLMIVDTFTYPTLVRDGELAVVLPEAVRAIIEVKSQVTAQAHLVDTLAQVGRTRRLIDPASVIPTILFAYDSTSDAATLRRWFESAYAHGAALRAEEAAAKATAAVKAEGGEVGTAAGATKGSETHSGDDLEPSYFPSLFVNAEGLIALRSPGTTVVYTFWANRVGDAPDKPKGIGDPSAAIVYLLDFVLREIFLADRSKLTDPEHAVLTTTLPTLLGVTPPASIEGVGPLSLPLGA